MRIPWYVWQRLSEIGAESYRYNVFEIWCWPNNHGVAMSNLGDHYRYLRTSGFNILHTMPSLDMMTLQQALEDLRRSLDESMIVRH